MKKLESLDKNQRYNAPIDWGVDVFHESNPEAIKAAVKEYERTHPAEK
jgi:hypothetical protein